MFEEVGKAFKALTDFLSKIFEIFEIDQPQISVSTSGYDDLFDQAKALVESVVNLFKK